MAKCCDETGGSPLELLPAGLGTLPRQLRAFPDVRRDLLAAVAASGKPGLGHLRPSRNDFGLMWLEMWAYVADVLGFQLYVERAPS